MKKIFILMVLLAFTVSCERGCGRFNPADPVEKNFKKISRYFPQDSSANAVVDMTKLLETPFFKELSAKLAFESYLPVLNKAKDFGIVGLFITMSGKGNPEYMLIAQTNLKRDELLQNLKKEGLVLTPSICEGREVFGTSDFGPQKNAITFLTSSIVAIGDATAICSIKKHDPLSPPSTPMSSISGSIRIDDILKHHQMPAMSQIERVNISADMSDMMTLTITMKCAGEPQAMAIYGFVKALQITRADAIVSKFIQGAAIVTDSDMVTIKTNVTPEQFLALFGSFKKQFNKF